LVFFRQVESPGQLRVNEADEVGVAVGAASSGALPRSDTNGGVDAPGVSTESADASKPTSRKRCTALRCSPLISISPPSTFSRIIVHRAPASARVYCSAMCVDAKQ